MTTRPVLMIVLGTALLTLPQAAMAQGKRADLPERVRGAAVVVVGVVVDVEPVLQENEFGDQLIVSHTTVQVQEVIKGPANLTTVTLEVEGGTLGRRTLEVSDIDPVALGQRGVFMVSQGASGANVPHMRGEGLLHLDGEDQVVGESWSLDDIRVEARGQAGNRQ